MKCPICKNVDLLLSERYGVEIDYCPNCRGIWLDRSELDKIIEHSQSNNYEEEKDENPKSNKKDDEKYPKNKKHKKESFLSEIFDIF